MRYNRLPLFLLIVAVLALPARAQQEAIHWHHDLESAKSVAKASGRLVLVHFWTPSCGPCLALDQTVFNQPGVSAAIEAQLVPVKLNADENSATAQWYGINRVPTDVVITPDGQLVGKLISPSTPMAYVSEVTGLASKYSAKSGGAYATAANAAPVQPLVNAAYAGLNIAPNTPLAISPPTADANKNRNSFAGVGTATQAINPTGPPTNNPFMPNAGPAAPQVVSNPAATNPAIAVAQAPITPIGAQPAAQPPGQFANPYMAGPATAPPAQQPIAPPLNTPMPTAASYGATPPALPLAGPNIGGAPPLAAAALASPDVPAVAPDPSKLPPGSPPLGFDGYCPVSMRNSWKWVPGDLRWGVIHRGRTYLFAGSAEQSQFQADPDRYTPAFSGMDPVLRIDHKQNVSGKREHSLDFDGMFYMFASEATLQQFSANPHRYATSARQAMGISRGRLVR